MSAEENLNVLFNTDIVIQIRNHRENGWQWRIQNYENPTYGSEYNEWNRWTQEGIHIPRSTLKKGLTAVFSMLDTGYYIKEAGTGRRIYCLKNDLFGRWFSDNKGRTYKHTFQIWEDWSGGSAGDAGSDKFMHDFTLFQVTSVKIAENFKPADLTKSLESAS